MALKKISWTQHSAVKMRQYGLSKMKLLNILGKPDRKELGIVPGTEAVMRTNRKFINSTRVLLKKKFPTAFSNQQKAPGEVWLMYKDTKVERKIISAWRYPGISKPGEEIPIPDEIRLALENDDELK